MSNPTGDAADLRELRLDLEAELALAETGEPEQETLGKPIDQWLFDPTDLQRELVGLGNLLGAVEAIEDGLARAMDRPRRSGRYGRMFPDLDLLRADPRPLTSTGGNERIGDAAPVLDRLNLDGDDGAEAAGWPFFSQLIAHDITAGRSPITDGDGPGGRTRLRPGRSDQPPRRPAVRRGLTGAEFARTSRHSRGTGFYQHKSRSEKGTTL